MRSVLSDLYPEPTAGGSAPTEDRVQATASLPSTSTGRRSSAPRAVASTSSATGTPRAAASTSSEKPSLGSRSLSFIRSGVSAVSSLFAGPKRSGDVKRTRSASTPNKGKRKAAQPARPRTQSGTGINSPRRTARTVSDGDSPRQPASREAITTSGTGSAAGGSAEQSAERTGEQQTEQGSPPATQENDASDRTQLVARQEQTEGSAKEQLTGETSAQASEQSSSQQSEEMSDTAAKKLPRDRASTDEDRTSVNSEPFSSGPDDDEEAIRQQPTSTVATTDGEDDSVSMASPRSSRRVTFDENAPDTLLFTPEPGGGGRGSDDEGSVATASTDSDSEETPGDSFQRLLEMLRERSLQPVGSYSDEEGESSGHSAIDPSGHVARYLREQQGRQTVDDDESDIQEGEVYPFREERRHAFPSEPTPGQRRTSFADTIDEFLQYLQVITEDHKAHQEALMLLDEEPLPADGSDATSEAGDSAWSETNSEIADSVSEAGSVPTEVDSGLATSPPTSPPPLTDGEEDGSGRDEDKVATNEPGGSEVEPAPEEQDIEAQDETYHTNDTGQTENQQQHSREEDSIETNAGSRNFQSENKNIEPNAMSNNHPSSEATTPSPSSANNSSDTSNSQQAADGADKEVHDKEKSSNPDETIHQTASSETIQASSEGERDSSPAPIRPPPPADDNVPGAPDQKPPSADPSPGGSEQSSRVSSAEGGRRDSAALRSMLRASLPAVEVLGSHSDTDTLRERRTSLVTGTAGELLPPAADMQARSPGQTGSMEMMAKSPGEVSQVPTPVDSGGASGAISESEMSHHEPVRSFASIADRLLRDGSEEDAPRAVPSGVGPANSMAAISGQLLTDHNPAEPADAAGPADEADEETELHSIIMHGDLEQHTTETGHAEREEKGEAQEDTEVHGAGKAEVGRQENIIEAGTTQIENGAENIDDNATGSEEESTALTTEAKEVIRKVETEAVEKLEEASLETSDEENMHEKDEADGTNKIDVDEETSVNENDGQINTENVSERKEGGAPDEESSAPVTQVMVESDGTRQYVEPRITADSTSEISPTSDITDAEPDAIDHSAPKAPEGSTSMTEGAPNIATQTSTRLTLDIDGLGAVTSDISRQESFDSDTDDDEQKSEDDSEHASVKEVPNEATTDVKSQDDDEKARLEALALLDSERTNASSAEGTARTHTQEEDAMSRTGKWDVVSDEGESYMSTGSTDVLKESDSRSSMFSDLRSEVSEYTTGSEMDEDEYRRYRLRLASDGESTATLDDDEIFGTETTTKLGIESSTTGARKLVWSLIAMASGIVDQVQGSELRLNTNSRQIVQQKQKENEREEKIKHDTSIDEFNQQNKEEIEQPTQISPDDESRAQLIEKLKELHRYKVKEILASAETKYTDTISQNEQSEECYANIEDGASDKTISDIIYEQIKEQAEMHDTSIAELKAIHGARVKGVIEAAEDQIFFAANKVISFIKQTLHGGVSYSSGHEADRSEESNYGAINPGNESGSEQITLAVNDKILDVYTNLPVNSNNNIQVYPAHEDIHESNSTINENVSEESHGIQPEEKPFLHENETYELITKASYETATLDETSIEQSADNEVKIGPSSQDIAAIAVAITQSVLGEASNIVEDEETAARRLRIRQSISHSPQGSRDGKDHKSSMDEESEVTSETNQDDDNFEEASPDDSQDTEAIPLDAAAAEAAEDADASLEESPVDEPAADGDTEVVDAAQQEAAELTIDDGPSPDEAPAESSDEAAGVEQPLAEPEPQPEPAEPESEPAELEPEPEPAEPEPEPEPVEPEPPAEPEPPVEPDSAEEDEDEGPVLGSLSSSEESDEMMDEGQDTMDSNRIRYQTGEIRDQTQNVTSTDGITEDMLAGEPEDGAVMVGTEVAGEGADEMLEDTEMAAAEDQDDSENVDKDLLADDAQIGSDEQDAADQMQDMQGEYGRGIEDDGVKVSVMHADEPHDPVDPDLINLPAYESDALVPKMSLRTKSSFLAKDIVAPHLLSMTKSGSTVEEREAFAERIATDTELDLGPSDGARAKDDEDADDILAQYANDMDLESSGETEEETTATESSSGSQETIKDDEGATSKDNVFDWLRRVSTQMDEMGITDKLKEMYGEDTKKPIVMAPSNAEMKEGDTDDEVPEELPDLVSPKVAYSDTGMYHESSLSLDTSYRIRQSSTQTDVKQDDEGDGARGGARKRPGAARSKPCGSCPCCMAMKRVVSGSEDLTGTGAVRRRSTQSKEQPRRARQRPWTSPTRSVGDLLDDTSSTAVSSTCTASSVDGGDSYARRMRHPKRWLKQATDEFMRRECIRQVVLKNDLVSDGRIQTKVTRISRHPSSMTDCLAATKSRVSAGSTLQMEISKGETMVGGRTVNYQDVKIRTPKSCSGLSVRSAPRVRPSRSTPQDDDISKRFIDTYLSQSPKDSPSGRPGKMGRESKTRKKITIKTDCRK
ncbi:uncharacterized protein LOC122366995 [Amphibalanus amphitrite]|uniref:uncharacterized protein LOC122366995 n=1 Tax=Amphibalanus amphitrite TaxID=1232801 RepID=UPI001C9219C3|nr:uncharacterized protein LOC122366995 [Amphibalanus amphitrite]